MRVVQNPQKHHEISLGLILQSENCDHPESYKVSIPRQSRGILTGRIYNCYEPGARLSLHQDRNERDQSAPIVSVSLGLPAVFLFGGSSRSVRPKRYQLVHGDVVVWGGPARFNFHGIASLLEGNHPILGRKRINLTFRKAL